MDDIAKWKGKLEEITAAYMAEFGKLSGEELNWKPGPDRWSIAQVVDHIIITNLTYFPVFEKIREGRFRTPAMRKVPGIPAILGKLILKTVDPASRRKTKTFAPWEPGQSNLPADIMARFNKHQHDLMLSIKSLDQYLGKGLVIHSPINRLIVYPLDTAIDILVTHEERHLYQARSVLQLKRKV